MNKDAAIIAKDPSGNFYAINNRGMKIPLPAALAKWFTANQFALLSDSSFLTKALSTIPFLASSEHGTIKGSINGGGDFVKVMDRFLDRFYILFDDKGVHANTLGTSLILASSEHATIKRSINGGGDFVYYIKPNAMKGMKQQLFLKTPWVEMTFIGTKAVVDIGFNGVNRSLRSGWRSEGKGSGYRYRA